MPRAATTTDAFNAIAEPRRRDLIAALAGGHPTAVGELVRMLDLPQPTVSKHLRVLRKVGIVSVTKQGQHRMYRLEPQELKPVYQWIKTYEQYWTHQADRIKERAERAARERSK
jgi:DNA-binding transcriptional ArsR family regulator